MPTLRTLEPALKRWLRPDNLEACDSWRVLFGQHPKLRKRILAILCPVERTNVSFSDRPIAREDLRLTLAIT